MSTSIQAHHHHNIVPGLTLSETTYTPSLQIPEHAHHDVAYFHLVLEGGLSVALPTQTYDLGQHNLVFHAAAERRSNRFHNRFTRLFNIGLHSVLIDAVRDGESSVLNHSTVFADRAPLHLATRIHREFSDPDPFSPLIVEGLALEMLGAAARERRNLCGTKPPRWLMVVKDFLHAHFADKLELHTIAEVANIHPNHLTRTFRQHFRSTPGEYVRQLRVDWACRQLATTETPLAEISSTAGFADQSHFSRTFKRLTGLTPAQYRAAALNSR